VGLPSAEQEFVNNLSSYRAAAVSYVVTPPGTSLSPVSTFQRVLESRSAWIYHISGTLPYFTAATCRVSSTERLLAHVRCLSAATLVRRETLLPGWTASVDGRRVPIHRSQGIFQAVSLRPGHHEVEFAYLPPNIHWALAALAAGIVWLLLGLARWPRQATPGRDDAGTEPASEQLAAIPGQRT
jgi:hypothetical protein